MLKEKIKRLEENLVTLEEFRKNTSLDDLYFVHESSYVDDGVEIGEGTKIWHFCHILSGSKIGKNCVLGQNVMVGPNVKIGNNVKIQNNVSVYEGVEIEDEVFCGPSCVFTNVINPRAFIERKHEFKKTLVKRGATIGANATHSMWSNYR
jgi:UDP-2-acetamido-3-amino-2,3-dideoxy-glucuronate N-acetyltransferase